MYCRPYNTCGPNMEFYKKIDTCKASWSDFLENEKSEEYYNDKLKDIISKTENKQHMLEEKINKIKQQFQCNDECNTNHTQQLKIIQDEFDFQIKTVEYYKKLPTFLKNYIPKKKRKIILEREISDICQKIYEEMERKIEQETETRKHELNKIKFDIDNIRISSKECIHGDFAMMKSPYKYCDICKECLYFTS